MTERDFIGYGATPPDPRWPGGARLALSFVVNVEEGAEYSILDGDPHHYHLSATPSQGTLPPIDDAEQHFSVNLGLAVVNEVRLELHCDDDCVDEIVKAIRRSARTGQRTAGWVYVTTIDAAHEIH